MIIAIAVIGLVGGAGYAALTPPKLTSQALVVLPQPKPNIATQTFIADSIPVLQNALSALGGESITSLQQKISAANVTPNVIQITAQDKTAAAAEKDANTVASSYVSYASSASSPVGPITAHILVPGNSVTGKSRFKQQIEFGGAGLATGILVGLLVAAQRSRTDRRLHHRAQITKAAGAPVLASIAIEPPTGTAGWQRLFEDYQPAATLSWQLRRVLDQLVVLAAAGPERHQSYLTIITLDGDEAALAVGPQLAAFAASMGIATLLVLGPLQKPAASNALYEAYAGKSMASPGQRLSHLLIDTPTAADADWQHPKAALTVAVATVDGNVPALPGPVRGSKIILAVSAGASTVHQLSRIVTAVDDVGSRITGIIVANPEPDDETTGLVRPGATQVPPRFSGVANGKVREVRR